MGMWCIDKGIWLSVIVLAVLSQIHCQTALKEIDGTFTMTTLDWNETYNDTSSHQYIDFVNTTADQIEHIFTKDEGGDSMVLEITFSNLREPNVTADVNIKLNTTLSDEQIGSVFGEWIHLHSYENQPFTVKDVDGNSSTTFASNVESSVQYIQSSETHVSIGLATPATEYLSPSVTEEHRISSSHATQELQSSSDANEVHVASESYVNNGSSTPVLIHSSVHATPMPGLVASTSTIENHISITSSSRKSEAMVASTGQPENQSSPQELLMQSSVQSSSSSSPSSRITGAMVMSTEQQETQSSFQEQLMQSSSQTSTHSSQITGSMFFSTEQPETVPSSQEQLMQSSPQTGTHSASLISEERSSEVVYPSSHIITGQAAASYSEQYPPVVTSVNEVQATSSTITDHQILASSSMITAKASLSTTENLPQSSLAEQRIETSTSVVENAVNTQQMDISSVYTTSTIMATESLRQEQESSSAQVQTAIETSDVLSSVKSSIVDASITDEPSSQKIPPMLTSSSIFVVIPSDSTDQNLKTSIVTNPSVIDTVSSSEQNELIGTSSDLIASNTHTPVSVYATDIPAVSLNPDSSSGHDFSSPIENVGISSSSRVEHTETQSTEMSMDIAASSSSTNLPIAHDSTSSKVIDVSEFATSSIQQASSTSVVASMSETSTRMPIESSTEVSSMTDETNKSTAIVESEVSQSLKLSMDQTVQEPSATPMLSESHLLQTTPSLIADVSQQVSSLYESAPHGQETSYQMNSEMVTEIPPVSSVSQIVSSQGVIGASMEMEIGSSSIHQTPLLTSTPINVDISSESFATSSDVMAPMSEQSSDIQSSLVHMPVESEQVSNYFTSSSQSHTSVMDHLSQSVNLALTPSLGVMISSTEDVVQAVSSEGSEMTPVMETSSIYMPEQLDTSLGSVGESTSVTMIAGITQSQMESSEVYSSFFPQSDSMSSEAVRSSMAIDGVVSASFEESATSMTLSEGSSETSSTYDMSSPKLDLSFASSGTLHMSSNILESTQESMFESLVSSRVDIIPSQTEVSEIISSQSTAEGMLPEMESMAESVHASMSSSMVGDTSTMSYMVGGASTMSHMVGGASTMSHMVEDTSTMSDVVGDTSTMSDVVGDTSTMSDMVVDTSTMSYMVGDTSTMSHVSTMSPSIDILSSEPISSTAYESSEATQLLTDLVSSEASYSGTSSNALESSSSEVIPLPDLSHMSTDTMSTAVTSSSQGIEMATTELMDSEIGSSSSSVFVPLDTSLDIVASTVEVVTSSSSLSEQIPPIEESIMSTISSTSSASSPSVMMTTEVMLSESSPTTVVESSAMMESSDVSHSPTMSSYYSMLVSSEMSTSSEVSVSSSPIVNVPSYGTSSSLVPTSADDSSSLLSYTDSIAELLTSTYEEMSTSASLPSSLEMSTSYMSSLESSSGLLIPTESSSEIRMSDMESSSSMMSEISNFSSSTVSSSIDTSSILVLLPTSTVSTLSSSMDSTLIVLPPISTAIMQSSSMQSSDMNTSSSIIALPTSEAEVTSSSMSSQYLSSSSMSTIITSTSEMVSSSSILLPGMSSSATSSSLELGSSSLMPTSVYQSSTFVTTSLIMSSPEMSSESITFSSSMTTSSSVGWPTMSSVMMSSQIESSTSSSSQTTSSTPIVPASSSIFSSSSVVMPTSVDIAPSSSSAVTESSSVTVTLPVEESVQGQFRITNDTIWTESLEDKNSQEYKSLAADLQTRLTNLFQGSSLKSSFLEIGSDMTFRKGSVIVDYTVKFRSAVPSGNVTTAFKESIAENNNLLGNYPIDTTSIVHGNEISQTTNPPIMTTEPAETTSRAQLLPHWAIAVLVCGGVLLVFLLFMMFVLCSRRHTRQKYRMPEDPDDIGYRRSWASSNSGSGEFAYENKLEISDSFDGRKLPLAEGSELALNDSSPRHKSNDPKTNRSVMEDRENGRHKPRIINGRTTLYDIEQDSWETHL